MTLRLAASVILQILAWAVADGAPQPQDVAFVARCDGSTQHYVVLLPPGFRPDRPHHVLIGLHGHGADRWQYIRDRRDECRAARDVAAERHMIFVSPDYRARTSWMGPKAEADMLQILEELRSRYRVGKVILCGGSMGGSAALTFAVLHPERVDGVVSMNGTANHVEYDKFQDAIRESFGGTKAQIPEEYKRRSAEYWPERLTMPVGITAGGEDAVVPPQSVVRLAGALKQRRRDVLLVWRDQGGHSTNYEDGRAVLEFVIDQATARAKQARKTND